MDTNDDECRRTPALHAATAGSLALVLPCCVVAVLLYVAHVEERTDARSGAATERVGQLFDAVARGEVATVQLWLAAGNSIDVCETGSSVTPLMRAVTREKPGVVRLLLARGANPNATSTYGTALSLAVFHGAPLEMVSLLLDHGANPDVQDYRGFTPLMVAAADGRVETVKLLLRRGADVHVRGSCGRTALDLVVDDEDGLDPSLKRLLMPPDAVGGLSPPAGVDLRHAR